MKEKLLEMIENNEFFSEDYRESLKEMIPEFKKCDGFPQDNPNHCYDVYTHTLVAMENCYGDVVCKLACLLHDIGKPDCHSKKEGCDHFYGHERVSATIAYDVLKRAGFSEDIIKDVCFLIEIHDMTLSPNSVIKYINKFGREHIERLMFIREADIKAQSKKYMEWRLDGLLRYKTMLRTITDTDIMIDQMQIDINGNKIKQIMQISSSDRMDEIIKDIKTKVFYQEIKNEHSSIVNYLIGRRDGENERSKQIATVLQ